MKALSYVVASILMLIITIALSGMAWLFISGFFNPAGISIEDGFCNLGEVTLKIKNIGTSTISSLDIVQTDPEDDILVRQFQGSIEPGQTVEYTDTCEGEQSRSCIYRISPSGGRTIIGDVQCSGRPASLVMALHFDEESGTEAKDSSANGNDGTLVNMEAGDWVPGKYGNALSFDGLNEYIKVDDSPSFDFGDNGEVTIEMWIKPYVFNSNELIGKTSGFIGFNSKINPAGTVDVSFDSFGGSALATSLGTLALNEWNHLTFVLDQNDLSIYINGEFDNSVPRNPGLVNFDNVFDLKMAKIFPAWNYFEGIIDEVKIYNKALI